MAFNFPITGTSQTLDFVLLLLAWIIVAGRIKKASAPPSVTVTHLTAYFYYFMIFNAFMALPTLLIFAQPSLFPFAMGWGYTIANIFLLISLSHLSRMATNIFPRWASREHVIHIIWIVTNAVLTVLNVIFVALQNQPTYNSATHLTQFHIPAALGPILGIVSLAAYLPPIALFAFTAIKYPQRRIRAGLLSLGMLIIMVAGPLHAAATSWQLFLTADIFNVISLALLAGGVLYRFDEPQEAATTQPVQPQVSH